jgi:hypothetical protein
MRNSEAKKVKTCKGCGNEIKSEKGHSKLCYSCRCTIDFVNKGAAHTPSHKAVKAQKHIFDFGYGWLDNLMNISRK